jgi:hypothetical protein
MGTSCFSNVEQVLGETYLCEPMTRAFSTLEQCGTSPHCYSLTFPLKLKVRTCESLSLVFDLQWISGILLKLVVAKGID